MTTNNGEIIFYQEREGQVGIEVKLEGDTVWLSQKQMGDLFGKDANTIGAHIKNIYSEKELDEEATTTTFHVSPRGGQTKNQSQCKIL